MYHIEPSSDPYSPLIAQSIMREFPSQRRHEQLTLVDLITAEILGTKQHRYGPKPNPESLVAIRDVIRFYTERELPIPFLVPWGSLKPNGGSVDLAEVWGLKMLHCLDARVSGNYSPGIRCNIRVEDASAPNLFFDRMEQTSEDCEYYASAFTQLVKVLDLDSVIEPVRESDRVNEHEFTSEAEAILPIMFAYLNDPSNVHAYDQLLELGWKGLIPEPMKEFYYAQYVKLYPGDDQAMRIYRLARYLSGSLARKRLKISVADQAWSGGFIELSFLPSPPGTEGHFGRRVYYRTLPSAITRNHMPPWRAKGYMLITSEDDLCPKLASFSDPQEYNPNTVTLVNGDKSVTVQADYIVA